MTSELARANGWLLLADPLFIDQVSLLENQVRKLKLKLPDTFESKNATKRLQAITKLITEVIPADPNGLQLKLGNTLGSKNRHWFRAKFFQQYRLFFRFDSKSKIIIYCWVNDQNSLRAYESNTDAYAVFKRMLDSGEPPQTWLQLLARSQPL
jgi:toxin YhaV